MQVAFAHYMRLRNINSATPSTTLDKLYHSELDHQQQQKTLQVLWTKVFNKWIKTHTNVDKSGGAKTGKTTSGGSENYSLHSPKHWIGEQSH